MPEQGQIWRTDIKTFFVVDEVTAFDINLWTAIIIWNDGHISVRDQEDWPTEAVLVIGQHHEAHQALRYLARQEKQPLSEAAELSGASYKISDANTHYNPVARSVARHLRNLDLKSARRTWSEGANQVHQPELRRTIECTVVGCAKHGYPYYCAECFNS